MFSLQAVFIKVTAGFPPRHTHSSNVTGSCESLSREGFMEGSASQVRSILLLLPHQLGVWWETSRFPPCLLEAGDTRVDN